MIIIVVLALTRKKVDYIAPGELSMVPASGATKHSAGLTIQGAAIVRLVDGRLEIF